MDHWRDSGEWNWVVKGGAVAGVVGGLVIALLAFVMSGLQGQDLWVGTKLAAFPFLGDRALAPGFDAGPVLLGLLCHFGVSITWGILFGLLAFGMTASGTVWFGVLWGFVVWITMDYAVLPALGAGALARSVSVVHAVVNHVIFGLALAVGFLPYQRTHSDGRPWWQHRRHARVSR